MRKVTFIPLLLTETTDIYTIRIEGSEGTAFHRFLGTYNGSNDRYIREDLDRILAAIEKISQNGALESYFRPEGRMNDRLCAIPLLISSRDKAKHGTLRVYCIRISDSLLIIGEGGIKYTMTYDEDIKMASIVKTLQSIDSELEFQECKGIDLKDNIMNITLTID